MPLPGRHVPAAAQVSVPEKRTSILQGAVLCLSWPRLVLFDLEIHVPLWVVRPAHLNADLDAKTLRLEAQAGSAQASNRRSL